jgi:hypothetical protein
MKKSICLVASLLALTITPGFGQPATPPRPLPPPQPASPQASGDFQQRLKEIVERANPPATPPPPLTKFNLDFPGGTPAELVKAIQKATGKPLNVIISTEDADIQLPPLKMNEVTTLQLFAALETASRKIVTIRRLNTGLPPSYSDFWTAYIFKTADRPVSDTSIWYFDAEKPSLPPIVSIEVSTVKICRFYSLDPYLNRGFTVDDITTAIQTGWKMAGLTSPPKLEYHKETKLLVAYGEPGELQTIQDVLQTLPATSTSRHEIDGMKSDIQRLQSQVDKLTVKLSELPPTQTASPK